MDNPLRPPRPLREACLEFVAPVKRPGFNRSPLLAFRCVLGVLCARLNAVWI